MNEGPAESLGDMGSGTPARDENLFCYRKCPVIVPKLVFILGMAVTKKSMPSKVNVFCC